MAYEYRTKAGDVLDILCAKIYRRDDMIPFVLQNNTHLFNYSAILPMGLTIIFLAVPVSAKKTKQRKGLWGEV